MTLLELTPSLLVRWDLKNGAEAPFFLLHDDCTGHFWVIATEVGVGAWCFEVACEVTAWFKRASTPRKIVGSGCVFCVVFVHEFYRGIGRNRDGRGPEIIVEDVDVEWCLQSLICIDICGIRCFSYWAIVG